MRSAWLDPAPGQQTLPVASDWHGKLRQWDKRLLFQRPRGVHVRNLSVNCFSWNDDAMGPPWDGQALTLFPNNQSRKETAVFFFQRHAINVANQACLQILQRRTLLESWNLSCVKCATQSSKLLHVVFGSWWNLGSIVLKTKESAVLHWGEKLAGALSPCVTGMHLPPWSCRTVCRACSAERYGKSSYCTVHWSLGLKCKNHPLEPKFN